MVDIKWRVVLGLSVGAISGCALDASEVAEADTTAESREAFAAAYDRPPAAAAEVQVNGVSQLWVLACDNQHRLRRKINTGSAGSDNWSNWATIATDCNDVPTVAPWSQQPTDQVVAYGRRTDDHLIEYWWPDPQGAVQIGDVSNDSGIGPISGAPLLAEVSLTDNVISIIVSTDQGNVYSVDWHSNAWHTNKVVTSSGGSTAIKAPGNFRFLSGGPGCTPCVSFPSQISGKGLTSSDTTTNWVASRAWLASKTSTPNYFRSSSLDYNASGTGVIYMGTSTYKYAATFTDTVKTKTSTGSWVPISPCPVEGSPMTAWGGSLGYVRGTNQQLIRWLNSSTEGCTKLGGTIFSAPAMVRGNSTFKRYALYKGGSSRLYVYNGSTHVSLDLVLP